MSEQSNKLTKEELYKNFKIHPNCNGTFTLEKGFKYKDIKVPKGYTTNGANIPRILWSIWPPNNPKYLPAAGTHDYLCDLEDYKKADEYFKEIMEILEVRSITIKIFYTFVRLYHKIRYNQ